MRSLRLFLAALAVVVLVIVGVRSFYTAAPSPALVSAVARRRLRAGAQKPSAETQIKQRLRDAPEYSHFFKTYAQAFPSDYAQLMKRFAKRDAVGGKIRTPDFYMSKAIAFLRRTRGILAANAQSPPLERIFEVQSKVMKALASADPRLCVEFLYGGSSPAFRVFAAGRRDLIADLGEAALAAILDGQTHRIDRTAPTPVEFQQLETDLASRGLQQSEIRALLDGRTPDPPLSDQRMCAAGLTYLDALRALPDDTRARMYALAVELMARS
ncbi:MAG TPA: hypothetical protein VND97_06130 [Beijerinckiaceae bacterium]|nr:hypothetical protein [Beijerinckiaceae bacterium]